MIIRRQITLNNLFSSNLVSKKGLCHLWPIWLYLLLRKLKRRIIHKELIISRVMTVNNLYQIRIIHLCLLAPGEDLARSLKNLHLKAHLVISINNGKCKRIKQRHQSQTTCWSSKTIPLGLNSTKSEKNLMETCVTWHNKIRQQV
jgi:hypothetical protein